MKGVNLYEISMDFKIGCSYMKEWILNTDYSYNPKMNFITRYPYMDWVDYAILYQYYAKMSSSARNQYV